MLALSLLFSEVKKKKRYYCQCLSSRVFYLRTFELPYKLSLFSFDFNFNSKDSDVCINVPDIVHFFLSVFCKII